MPGPSFKVWVLSVDFDQLTTQNIEKALSDIETTRSSLSGVTTELNQIFLESIGPDGSWECKLQAQPRLAEWVRKVGSYIKFPGLLFGTRSTDDGLRYLIAQAREAAVQAATKISEALEQEHSCKADTREVFDPETEMFDYPYDVSAAGKYPDEEYEYCYLPLLIAIWQQWTQYVHAQEDVLSAVQHMVVSGSESETSQPEPACLTKARATAVAKKEESEAKPLLRIDTWTVETAAVTRAREDTQFTTSPTDLEFKLDSLARAETIFDATKENNPWPEKPPFTQEELKVEIEKISSEIVRAAV